MVDQVLGVAIVSVATTSKYFVTRQWIPYEIRALILDAYHVLDLPRWAAEKGHEAIVQLLDSQCDTRVRDLKDPQIAPVSSAGYMGWLVVGQAIAKRGVGVWNNL